jgi:hypothetical protein
VPGERLSKLEVMKYESLIAEALTAVPELPDFEGVEGWAIVHDLPHPVISALTRFLVCEFRKVRPGTSPAPEGPFSRALRYLDRALVEGDAETSNAVVVSCLEILENYRDVFDELRLALTPPLRKALDEIPW